MRVSKKTIQKWCDALRSGKYKQTKQRLQDHLGFCCLGVACDIFIPQNKKDLFYENNILIGGTPDAQPHAPRWLNHISYDFANKTGYGLIKLNDSIIEPYSFDEIADLLEAVYIHEVLA